MQTDNRVIVALDNMNAFQALFLADKIKDLVGAVKVGHEMFSAEGPQFLRYLRERGVEVFLDLKYHDISNTVKKAITRVTEYEPLIIDVHASGGEKMMIAAKEGAEEGARCASAEFGHSVGRPLVVAVTVLTSLDTDDLISLGLLQTETLRVMSCPGLLNFIPELTKKMAMLAQKSGLDGVVCSASDAKDIRTACGPDFIIITPGIRWPNSKKDDQKRVDTPTAAILAGADWLVIGRLVTESKDPVDTLKQVNEEIAAALESKAKMSEISPAIATGEYVPYCTACGHKMVGISGGSYYRCENCGEIAGRN